MPGAMVWGVSGGIGSAIAGALVAQGWKVVGLLRQGEAPAGVARVEVDVADEYKVREALLQAAYKVDQVDLWIYAVGDILSQSVAGTSHADWSRILNANLTGAFLAAQHSLPLLAPDAQLVFVGAISERLRLPGLAAYAAAKAGLEAFVAALAKEERARKVLLVRPAAVDTPLWRKVPLRLPKGAQTPEQTAQAILSAHAAGRTGVLDL